MTDDKNRQAPTDQEGAPSADQEKGQKKIIIVDTPKRGYTREEIAEYLKTDEGRAAAESLKESIVNISEIVSPAIKALQQPLKIAESITSAMQRVREIQVDISKIVQAMMQANISTWAPAELDFEALDKFYTEIEELTPYLNAEIKKYPEYEGKSYTDLIDELPFSAIPDLITAATDTGTNTEEPAETEPAEAEEPAEGEEIDPEEEERIYQIITDLLTIRDAARRYKTTKVQGTDKIDYPVDKPNNNMWDNVWRALKENPDGQLTFSFDVKKRGEKEELPLLVSINFDALQDIEITKRLTPFDKRVYIAISALFNAGNDVITLSTIYRHMGYKGRAGGSDLEKIHKSVLKMLAAQITVDNELEVQRHKKYGHFKYRGTLLPVELGEFYNVQGALTDAAIHILREPPLMTFARNRDQITTVSLKLLQSPVNKTDANLMLEDYLIVQIKRAQKNKAHGRARMLYKTIYKHAGIPEKPTTSAEKSAKQRAPGKIEKYLKHYQQEGTITSYSIEKDGVTIHW